MMAQHQAAIITVRILKRCTKNHVLDTFGNAINRFCVIDQSPARKIA